MIIFFISLASALWLGILTSVSPCPMATNVAAIGFISKNIEDPKKAFLTSIYYLLGRAVGYLIVALIVIWGIFNMPLLSIFLQKYMNKVIGPLLIIVGLYLLGIVSFKFQTSPIGEKGGEKIIKLRGLGGFLLGLIFALAFCPVSAALFFGSLIPLAVSNKSYFIHPLLYGIGTGLPVTVVAMTIVFAIEKANKVFKIIRNIERFGKVITAIIFVAIGIYLVSKSIFLF